MFYAQCSMFLIMWTTVWLCVSRMFVILWLKEWIHRSSVRSSDPTIGGLYRDRRGFIYGNHRLIVCPDSYYSFRNKQSLGSKYSTWQRAFYGNHSMPNPPNKMDQETQSNLSCHGDHKVFVESHTPWRQYTSSKPRRRSMIFRRWWKRRARGR